MKNIETPSIVRRVAAITTLGLGDLIGSQPLPALTFNSTLVGQIDFGG